MNLRVDLIAESEQRSASMVSAKLLIRLTGTIVPALLIALLAIAVFRNVSLKGELDMLESQWRSAEPRKKSAERQREQLLANRETRDELVSWRQSRIVWHEQLAALMELVPEEVQLKRLRVGQNLHLTDDEIPARSFTLAIEGKAAGEKAEQNVQLLRSSIEKAEAFTNLASEVVVQRYGADTGRDAGPDDRVFSIECSYHPREFE